MTLTQFAVLEALYHLGPMSLSDIAQKVLTTGGNLTMVVGNLGKAGLAKRQQLPGRPARADRRADPKGKTLIRKSFPSMPPPSPQFLGGLVPRNSGNWASSAASSGKPESRPDLSDRGIAA